MSKYNLKSKLSDSKATRAVEILEYLIYDEETHPAELRRVLIYRERAFARCDGCDSRLLFPFVCVHISPVASYSPPSESAESGGGGVEQREG